MSRGGCQLCQLISSAHNTITTTSNNAPKRVKEELGVDSCWLILLRFDLLDLVADLLFTRQLRL